MTTSSLADLDPGITLGSAGQRARWSVSPWGSVTQWGASDVVPLDWCVAADDRWHVPAREPSVRQRRIDGTPVVETRVRVPDGDAVQRTWAVPDGGGAVIVEFENDSPMPLAVALTGSPIVTERPPADIAVEGIDLAGEAVVMPIGHRSVVRAALVSSDGALAPGALRRVPPALAVVRGWTRTVERASRLVLPDEGLAHAVIAARSDLLLEGPVDPSSDPEGFLLDVAELVRCGDDADAWLPDIVEPAERMAKSARRRTSSASDRAAILRALSGASRVASVAGDARAAGDIDRAIGRIRGRTTDVDTDGGVTSSYADLRRDASVGRFVRSVERRLVDGGRCLTGGFPTSWQGSNFEVHTLPTSSTTSVSFAVRWHGQRPAVLWEQHGPTPVRLTAPDVDPEWSTVERSGEALWPAPSGERRTRPSLSITAAPDDGPSFV